MIECGFFNSVNKDRLYTADMMTRPYELLISNGVFATPEGKPSSQLQVVANDGMSIMVKPGRGIFKDKWLINDSELPLTISTAEVTLTRIDSIIVKIDASESVRAGTIEIKKGTPASSPKAPVMERSEDVHEYRLADIHVAPQATEITQMNITDQRGSADCPWITSLIQQVDTSTLLAQWQYAYNTFYAESTQSFDDWFAHLKETVATQTLIRTFTSYYVTSIQDETIIPINIVQFNDELDILQVHINGLMLVEDVDYTIESIPASQITLTKPVDKGTPIAFTVYKSVDGSKAETIVAQVEQLQDLLDTTKITSDTGSTKISAMSGEDTLAKFLGAGKGFHTMYIQNGALNVPMSGAYRAFGHITGDGVGWLIILHANGSVFSNYLNGGIWGGWKALFETNPTALYTSNGVFPNADVEIVPTKSLAQCQHGWQMVFCGYDDSAKTVKDSYVQTVNIPKRSHKGEDWNGERVSYPLAYALDTDTGVVSMCAKTFQIYPTKMISGTSNSVGLSRNMVLKAIYEY